MGGDWATAVSLQIDCENVAAGGSAPGIYRADGVAIRIDSDGTFRALSLTPAERADLAALRAEYRMGHDPGDAWGSVMGAWFEIAEALEARGEAAPDHWLFRAGCMAPVEEDDAWTQFWPSDTLARFGDVLARWSRMLRHAGRSY
jgi:hypothetical protein